MTLSNLGTIFKRYGITALGLLAVAIVVSSILGIFFGGPKGRLSLKVSPSATVSLDRQNYGNKDSLETDLSAGKHRLVILKTGYQAYNSEITINPGQTLRLAFDLQPVPAVHKPLEELASGQPGVPGTVVVSPALSSDGRDIIYLSDAGSAFYRFSISSGIKEKVATAKLSSIQKVVWSSDQKQAVLVVDAEDFNLRTSGSVLYDPKARLQSFWTYNFVTQKISRLPDRLGDIIWVQSGSKLVLVQSPADGPGVNVLQANPDGSSVETLFEGGGVDTIHLSSGTSVSNFIYSPQIDGPAGISLYFYDLTARTAKKLIDTGDNKDLVFENPRLSPTGTSLLYNAVVSGQPAKIVQTELPQVNSRNLGVEGILTAASWVGGEKSAYLVALSGDLRNQSIWKVDLGSATAFEISGLPNESLKRVSDLLISPDGNKLFYVSNGTLYFFNLR